MRIKCKKCGAVGNIPIEKTSEYRELNKKWEEAEEKAKLWEGMTTKKFESKVSDDLLGTAIMNALFDGLGPGFVEKYEAILDFVNSGEVDVLAGAGAYYDLVKEEIDNLRNSTPNEAPIEIEQEENKNNSNTESKQKKSKIDADKITDDYLRAREHLSNSESPKSSKNVPFLKHVVICPSCGQEHNYNDLPSHCYKCGSNLLNTFNRYKNESYICSGCGGDNREDSTFCRQCHSSFVNNNPNPSKEQLPNSTSSREEKVKHMGIGAKIGWSLVVFIVGIFAFGFAKDILGFGAAIVAGVMVWLFYEIWRKKLP